MKLLVGTSNGLLLIEENKQINKLMSGFVYGITFDKSYIYAFKRGGKDRLHIFDKNFNKVKHVHVECSHVHQALYDPIDNRIYATSTGDNSLTIVNPKDCSFSKVRWHKHSKDHNHINSIFRHEDSFYVYEHDLKSKNQQRGNGGVRKLTKDWKSEQRWRIADQGHNIYILEDQIYVLDSFNRRFIRRPLNNKYDSDYDVLFSSEEYGKFGLRGLAITQDRIIVGLSKWLDRSKRDTKHTGYIVWYNRNYQKVDDLYLNEGQVLEIRALEERDYAHNNIVWEK